MQLHRHKKTNMDPSRPTATAYSSVTLALELMLFIVVEVAPEKAFTGPFRKTFFRSDDAFNRNKLKRRQFIQTDIFNPLGCQGSHHAKSGVCHAVTSVKRINLVYDNKMLKVNHRSIVFFFGLHQCSRRRTSLDKYRSTVSLPRNAWVRNFKFEGHIHELAIIFSTALKILLPLICSLLFLIKRVKVMSLLGSPLLLWGFCKPF